MSTPCTNPDRPDPVGAGPRYLLIRRDGQAAYGLGPGIHKIGRGADSNLRLDEPSISREHCVVSVDASGNCELRDAGSRNGTLVNGAPVTEPVRLKMGDNITIGTVRVVLVNEAEPPAELTGPIQGRLEWAASMGYLETAYDPE